MPKHPQASLLRLVDPDELVEPDPFAMPVPRPSPNGPVLRVVPRRHPGPGPGRAAPGEKPS